MSKVRDIDVLIVGTGFAASAAAKRCVDAGLETVALDFRKLPRYKICSGILAPRGHRFLIENFGPLPKEALHDPTSCRGVTFHFPSMISVSMDFFGGPTPHLNRQNSDWWAIQKSGVEVQDETAFKTFTTDGKRAVGKARRHGEDIEFRARYIIGADGPRSPVRRVLYPDYEKSIQWFMVAQLFQKIKDCPLSPDYFHFWFHPELGHYTWSHARDGRQIVGVGFKQGGNVGEYHRRVETYMREKHGVLLEPFDSKEGCAHNFGPSLINRYVFGKENILVTGQASGFFNMLAEGMSCAMHSGAIAGEAIVEAIKTNRPVQDIYRKQIVSEVNRCTDQWNIFKMLFSNPHEADFKAALKKFPVADRLRVVRDLIKFVPIYGEFGWGRQMLGQSLRRMILGSYSTGRWL